MAMTYPTHYLVTLILWLMQLSVCNVITMTIILMMILLYKFKVNSSKSIHYKTFIQKFTAWQFDSQTCLLYFPIYIQTRVHQSCKVLVRNNWRPRQGASRLTQYRNWKRWYRNSSLWKIIIKRPSTTWRWWSW